jgi:hypothetical protein
MALRHCAGRPFLEERAVLMHRLRSVAIGEPLNADGAGARDRLGLCASNSRPGAATTTAALESTGLQHAGSGGPPATGRPLNRTKTIGGLGRPFCFEGAFSMNPISNIWNQPKTSAAGLLIAVVTIAGVLSQQGLTLGSAGSGTVVTLAGAIATALLGLLARDPSNAAVILSERSESKDLHSGSTAKLGVWALIALLLPLPFVAGCSGTTVAQDIVNWTPALQSAVATVDSTAALLAPGDAPVFTAATLGFDAASNLLVAQAKAYLANPTASVLAQLQTQVVTFQQQVNAALLAAAKITNTASQQHALACIQGVATIVTAVFALVQSVSSKVALAKMASRSTIKLADVRPFIDEGRTVRIIASHYAEPVELARMQLAQAEANETRAGF